MKKKILGIVLALVTCLSVGCVGNKTVATTADTDVNTITNTETVEVKNELKVITVAASPVPHAEILYQVVEPMKALGYDLQVKEFSDYVIPNTAVEEGNIMANYFQHIPYLDDFNKERGTHIVQVGNPIHFEPCAIYAGQKATLELEDGDKIAVPNDVTNEARALLLLESAGIIKLREGAGLTATKLDIEENPKNVEIVELEAAQVPRSLQDVAIACMNGNYAMEAGYKVTDALFVESKDSEAAKTYGNIFCVKDGNQGEAWALDLYNCLKNQSVKDYIAKTYNQSVIAID